MEPLRGFARQQSAETMRLFGIAWIFPSAPDVFQGIGRTEDVDIPPLSQLEQVRVTGYDQVGAGLPGALQDGIVVRIRGDGSNTLRGRHDFTEIMQLLDQRQRLVR